MRAFFGLIGLLPALLIVFVLVEREMSAGLASPPAREGGLPPLLRSSEPASAPRDVVGQSQRIERQVQQAVENAVQQPLRNAPQDAQ